MKIILHVCLLLLSSPSFAGNGDDFIKNFGGDWKSDDGAASTPGKKGTIQLWIDGIQAGSADVKFAATAVCSYIDKNGTSVGWTVTSDWDGEKLSLDTAGTISKKCFGQVKPMGNGDANQATINTISCYHHQDGKTPDNIKIVKTNATDAHLTITHRDGTTCSGKVK